MIAPHSLSRAPVAAVVMALALSFSDAAWAVAPAAPSRATAQYHLMAGDLAMRRQMPETAAQEYLAALEFENDVDTAQRATGMALAAERADLAIKAARFWLAADPSAADPREVILRVALMQGDAAEAKTQAQALLQGSASDDGERWRQLAVRLSEAGGEAGATLHLMRDLVHQAPSAGAHRALALLSYRYKEYDAAERAARESLRREPGQREARMLLIGALAGQKRIAEADQELDAVLAGRSANEQRDVRFGYMRLLLETGRRDAARVQVEQVLKAQPLDETANWAMASLLMEPRITAEAKPYLEHLLKSPRANDAHYYLGRIAELQQLPLDAEKQYQAVQGGNMLPDAYLARARLMMRSNRTSEARSLLADAREQFPMLGNRLLLAEAELLAGSRQYVTALGLLDAEVKRAPEDANLRYSRALVLERMGRMDLAEKDLRAVVASDDRNPRNLNALGYLLLNLPHGSVSEAAGLIERAYKLAGSDPAVQDSYGWLLLRQGKSKDAVAVLEQSYTQLPDPEVAAHLGEAYWQLGQHDKARQLWQEGLKTDPEHPVLRDTLKRLRVSLSP